MSMLNTGVKIAKNVSNYTIGFNSISLLPSILNNRRETNPTNKDVIFFIDSFFKGKDDLDLFITLSTDTIIYIDAENEPTTDLVDDIANEIRRAKNQLPCAVIGIGGGTTMDVAKAVSNLLTNDGKARDYQGWDLVKQPGIFKIGIPTISGTGAEATRTCVLINKETNLKLGMNSDFTVFDQIILDPSLTKSVPRNQFFYSGMDTYIHCMEALSGSYRNAIGDSLSREALTLCRQVFSSLNMMNDSNREKLMVASYLGGNAIATTYVGIVHPFSAALSVVLGIHHCVANCIVMRAMEKFYPGYYQEFWEMADNQSVEIPKNVCKNLTQSQYQLLYESTIIHEKPLTNALGENFKKILAVEKVVDIFKAM